MSAEEIGKYFEYRHLVTFTDTNSTGNVYFARYFEWMGKCRELITAEHYPELIEDLDRGFGFATEFANIDFIQECFLFDMVLVRLKVIDLSRTRIEFGFDYIKEKGEVPLARGKQAVIWINSNHRPSLMPDKLYEKTAEYFGI